jgi:hypothetical protein
LVAKVVKAILAPTRSGALARAGGIAIGGLLIGFLAMAAPAWASTLADRAGAWPSWSLPAPLERPGSSDLTYPSWFEGTWQVRSDGLAYTVRFSRTRTGEVVGDRAFNAQAIGAALLGDTLQAVANDPANPNRQIATFKTPSGPAFSLESTVVGRRQEPPSPTSFEADELALQVLHGPGDPRVSRVETLSRYELQADGQIRADQWQATYPSPAYGLAAQPTGTDHVVLSLQKLSPQPPQPGSDPAS